MVHVLALFDPDQGDNDEDRQECKNEPDTDDIGQSGFLGYIAEQGGDDFSNTHGEDSL
jgi:hypothetical protein